MAEQPQWSERTLDMPPQDPWAEPATEPVRPVPDPQSFSRGRAQVNPHPRTQQFPAGHEPTGTGWPGAGAPEPEQRRSVGWHARELRRGGEWTSAAVLFAFVCWGIWAISEANDLTAPVIVFVLSLLVAAGLFALARVLGHYVLERQLNRVRRTARGSHIVVALFLTGVGIAHLQQTTWVMDAYHWIADNIF